MWIADMDFEAPQPVVQAVVMCAQRGIFGYTNPPPYLLPLVLRRLADVYGCDDVMEEWIGWLPGLVPGLSHAVRIVRDRAHRNFRAFQGAHDGGGAVGDVGNRSAVRVGVAVLTPAYPPFLKLPQFHGTALEPVPLVAHEIRDTACSGIIRFDIDWVALEAVLAKPQTWLLLLCNPHNPTGRCWPQSELTKLAKLCIRHDVLICSDEVWGEMVLDPARAPFTSMLALIGQSGLEGLSSRLIVLTSPSKCFNIATLNVALTVVPDAGLRDELRTAGADAAEVTPFGYFATGACYGHRDSEEWRRRLIHYIVANRDYAVARLTSALPGAVCVTQPESSYLLWVDATQAMGAINGCESNNTGSSSGGAGGVSAADHLLSRGVGASAGEDFGGGRGCFRLNLACARSTLELGLERIISAFDETSSSSNVSHENGANGDKSGRSPSAA